MTQHDQPTTPGWYWYEEDGKNLGKPMPVWVFDTLGILYACRMAPHEPVEFHHSRRLAQCEGRWLGPVESPQ